MFRVFRSGGTQLKNAEVFRKSISLIENGNDTAVRSGGTQLKNAGVFRKSISLVENGNNTAALVVNPDCFRGGILKGALIVNDKITAASASNADSLEGGFRKIMNGNITSAVKAKQNTTPPWDADANCKEPNLLHSSVSDVMDNDLCGIETQNGKDSSVLHAHALNPNCFGRGILKARALIGNGNITAASASNSDSFEEGILKAISLIEKVNVTAADCYGGGSRKATAITGNGNSNSALLMSSLKAKQNTSPWLLNSVKTRQNHTSSWDTDGNCNESSVHHPSTSDTDGNCNDSSVPHSSTLDTDGNYEESSLVHASVSDVNGKESSVLHTPALDMKNVNMEKLSRSPICKASYMLEFYANLQKLAGPDFEAETPTSLIDKVSVVERCKTATSSLAVIPDGVADMLRLLEKSVDYSLLVCRVLGFDFIYSSGTLIAIFRGFNFVIMAGDGMTFVDKDKSNPFRTNCQKVFEIGNLLIGISGSLYIQMGMLDSIRREIHNIPTALRCVAFCQRFLKDVVAAREKAMQLSEEDQKSESKLYAYARQFSDKDLNFKTYAASIDRNGATSAFSYDSHTDRIEPVGVENSFFFAGSGAELAYAYVADNEDRYASAYDLLLHSLVAASKDTVYKNGGKLTVKLMIAGEGFGDGWEGDVSVLEKEREDYWKK